MMTESSESNRNVGQRLTKVAKLVPGAIAAAQPEGRPPATGPRSYQAITFGELDDRSSRIARGLLQWGVEPETRLALLVPFSLDFLVLTFGLLKAGVTLVLIDPGMGRRHLINCLQAVRPDGFVAIPKAHAVRTVLRGRFPEARWNVTVGKRWGWGGKTLKQIEMLGRSETVALPAAGDDDAAAIIFTTGSTGPPKAVRYTHGIFNHQIDLIRKRYGIKPGTRDLACFPLFGLFDAVMGATTIIPDMDPTRPADVNPQRVLEAVEQWEIDQAFGSPALWKTVTRWCEKHQRRLPTLRRVLSAGAPVPPQTLAALRDLVACDAEIHTPYGATEALPVASIESREVLEQTASRSREGAGTCVGSRFDSIQWRVIRIRDEPLEEIAQTESLRQGEIGELMVRGPIVTETYLTRTEQNALHKVRDGEAIWHRMGDVGYLDDRDRFWFCGRKAHRVQTESGTLFTVPCEAIINLHPDVSRSALIGIGPAPKQTPVVIVELESAAQSWNRLQCEHFLLRLQEHCETYEVTRGLRHFRIHPGRLPVDIRHNSKIFREQLATHYAGTFRRVADKPGK